MRSELFDLEGGLGRDLTEQEIEMLRRHADSRSNVIVVEPSHEPT